MPCNFHRSLPGPPSGAALAFSCGATRSLGGLRLSDRRHGRCRGCRRFGGTDAGRLLRPRESAGPRYEVRRVRRGHLVFRAGSAALVPDQTQSLHPDRRRDRGRHTRRLRRAARGPTARTGRRPRRQAGAPLRPNDGPGAHTVTAQRVTVAATATTAARGGAAASGGPTAAGNLSTAHAGAEIRPRTGDRRDTHARHAVADERRASAAGSAVMMPHVLAVVVTDHKAVGGDERVLQPGGVR